MFPYTGKARAEIPDSVDRKVPLVGILEVPRPRGRSVQGLCPLWAEMFGKREPSETRRLSADSLRALEKRTRYKAHSESEYHKTAILDTDHFVQLVQGESVKERVNPAACVQEQANRKKLMSIIEVILFCGRKGIALRGHCDAGPLTLEDPLENEGNFRALVGLKIRSGNDLLRDHLEIASGNATYPSPQIQN